MKFCQIVLSNIGPYRDENMFSFDTSNSQKNIVLFGGRNGAGKTTIFDAIRVCLYGYKLFGYRQNNKSYTAMIKRLINNREKEVQYPKAKICLCVQFEDGYDDNKYTIIRKWDFHKTQLREQYSVYQGSHLLSNEELEDFDDFLLRTIPPALFNLHFFNGESMSSFVFKKESGISFRKAFLQICGLDTFDLIQEQLDNAIIQNANDKVLLTRNQYHHAQEQKTQLEEALSEESDKLDATTNNIMHLEDEITYLEQEMMKFGGVQSQEWENIQTRIQAEEKIREEKHRYLKECANHVLPFILLNSELAKLREQIFLESKLASNRTLSKHLLLDKTKKALWNNLKSFFRHQNDIIPDEFVERLFDAIKYDCPTDRSEILNLSEKEQRQILAQIDTWGLFDKNEIVRAEKSIKASLRKTKRLREEAATKEILSADDYFASKSKLLMEIDDLRKKVVELSFGIGTLESRLKDVNNEFSSASFKYKSALKEQSISDLSARTFLAFDEIKTKLFAKNVQKVENAFSSNFASLLSKKHLLDGIYIDTTFEIIPYKNTSVEINHMQSLLKQQGYDLFVETFGERAFHIIEEKTDDSNIIDLPIKLDYPFSAGEQQIFYMALYQAMAEIRTAEIPFVIDTPLARIDSVHRKNIIKNFFSKLPGQVLILSTDEEIDTASMSLLHNRLSDCYLIENQEDGTTKIAKNQYFKE